MSNKSDPKPWPMDRWTGIEKMPGRLTTDQMLRNYRKGGRKNLTPKQMRRLEKKTARSIYSYVMSCGHRLKKCECPF